MGTQHHMQNNLNATAVFYMSSYKLYCSIYSVTVVHIYIYSVNIVYSYTHILSLNIYTTDDLAAVLRSRIDLTDRSSALPSSILLGRYTLAA